MATIGQQHAPPDKKRTPSTRKASEPVLATDQHKERVDGLQGLWEIGQFGCLITGQLADAATITKHSPRLSEEIVNVCEGNEKREAALDKAIAIGPFAALLGAALPFVMQLLVNHKIMPAEFGAAQGVVSPEALEAQQKAAMIRQATEAIRMQRDAEEEMQRLSSEWIVGDDDNPGN